jgi:CubicO group peptidase (beta-lactamase class C family)
MRHPLWAVAAIVLSVNAGLASACAGPAATVVSAPPQPAVVASTPKASPDAELTAAIDNWIAASAKRSKIRAFLVSVDGKRIVDSYYGAKPERAWDTESVTKSVISMLLGIAISEGRIAGLDQTLRELLPDHVAVMTPAVAKLTLRQLLTMTAGIPNVDTPTGPEFASAPNWVDAILTSADPRGVPTFLYANGDSHLLAAILERATGSSVLDYAREKLFGPLGIDIAHVATPIASIETVPEMTAGEVSWPVDPQGVNLGWALLALRPSDLARLGQMYLDGGKAAGVQVVPAQWVAESTTSQAPAYGLTTDYGYQWWVGKADGVPAYMALGFGGQVIEVVPDRGLVVAVATQFDLLDETDYGVPPEQIIDFVDTVIAPSVNSDSSQGPSHG